MKDFHPETFFDLTAYRHKALFDDCQYVWQALAKIKGYLSEATLGRIQAPIEEGVILVHPETITIEEGSVIEPGAYIKGPCWIGKDCTVRHGAYIRGNVITGDRCVIGHATEVKHSLFLDDAHAAHFAYVGDSILGNHTNLGAGTKCANLRLDNQSVRISGGGVIIDSGLRKFGAVIGDRAQTGCNSVTNPGTLIGKGACSYPCVSLHGVIEEGQVVRS